MNQNQFTLPKQYYVLLGSAVLILVMTTFWTTTLAKEIWVSSSNIVAEKSIIINPSPSSLPVAEVLGAKTTRAVYECPSLSTMRSNLISYLPTLNIKTIPNELFTIYPQDLIQCWTFPSCTENSSANQCNNWSLKLNRQCVQDFVDKAQFPEPPTQKLSNKTREITVSIADHNYDVSSIVPAVTAQYSNLVSACDIQTANLSVPSPLNISIPVYYDRPNTNGSLAKRYVEVDGSRNLIFLWSNGKLKHTLRTSGAFAEWNPIGLFSIINKSPDAWSPIAKKWMPYWMAFTYDSSQKAWLGFHSLVYWYEDYKYRGLQKFFEPTSNIGQPRSTGCIRTAIKDSKLFYDFMQIGDLVVIHD